MRTSRGPARGGRPGAALVLGLLLVLTGCGEDDVPSLVTDRFGSARLTVRPSAPTAPSTLKGQLTLRVDGDKRGVLLVPQAYQPGTAAPLVVLLHGAGGLAEGILEVLREHAEATGTLVLAPKAAGSSWDLMEERHFGTDTGRLDATLAQVFREYSVDPERIFISGFSDGASYALSVGLTNGDLFRRIGAFSAGFVAASELQGRPEVFLSHGTRDAILPVEDCGRLIHQQLRGEGYTVQYREFAGPHTVTENVAREGFTFLVGAAAP